MSAERITPLLMEVFDPEIPVLSIVDLGIVSDTKLTHEGNGVEITLTPTFVGCPALAQMETDIREKLVSAGFDPVVIHYSFRNPWTSDRISPQGREVLRTFGLAPPPSSEADFQKAECPRCRGTHTELRSLFGATLCRSIHYCLDCRESFEQFKAI